MRRHMNGNGQVRAETDENLVTLMVVGNHGVGKSTFVNLYRDGRYSEGLPTNGVRIVSKDQIISGAQVLLVMLDATGDWRNVEHAYYAITDAHVLMFDLTNIETFYAVNTWLRDVDHFRYNDKVYRRVLVGNKSDGERAIAYYQAKAFADSIGADYAETSTMTDDNARETIELLVHRILRARGVPTFTLREDVNCCQHYCCCNIL